MPSHSPARALVERAPATTAGLKLGSSRFEELLLQLLQEHRRAVRQSGPAPPPEQLLREAACKAEMSSPHGKAPGRVFMPDSPTVEAPTLEGFETSVLTCADADAADRSADAPACTRRNVRSTTATSSASNRRGNSAVLYVKRMMDRFKFNLDIAPKVEETDASPLEVSSPMSRTSTRGSILGRASRRASQMVATASEVARKNMQDVHSGSAQVFEPGEEAEEQPGLRMWVSRFARSNFVELAMAVIIFTNTLVLALEAQYEGTKSGYDYQLKEPDMTSSQVWPGADAVFKVTEWVFGILFTLEFVAKLTAIGVAYFKDPWNALDFVIVAFWLLEQVFNEFLPLDPKLVRMARLARLLRFLRVVKTIQAFDSLYLMMASIKSSISALTWSTIVLLLLEMMLALFLNVMLEDFWSDSSNPAADRQMIYDYFGTFTRALQTMVEMLLGNWYGITRLLTSTVSEWYALFGIIHQMIIGFAVIEVITGVFLHHTFKVANMDDGILLNETKREIKDQSQKMLRFFQHADVDGSGELSKEEFKEVLGKDKVQEWMGAMGLDVHQVEKVFHLFDADKSGTITPEELIAGTLQLKGQAKAMELALVRTMVEDIHRMLRRTSPGSKESRYSHVQDRDKNDATLGDTLSTVSPQISTGFSRQTSEETGALLPGQAY